MIASTLLPHSCLFPNARMRSGVCLRLVAEVFVFVYVWVVRMMVLVISYYIEAVNVYRFYFWDLNK